MKSEIYALLEQGAQRLEEVGYRLIQSLEFQDRVRAELELKTIQSLCCAGNDHDVRQGRSA